MATPRPNRRPLGSIATNNSSLNAFNKDSPEHDERSQQLKASLSALTGMPSMAPPTPRRQSANNTNDMQMEEGEVGDRVSVPGDMTGIVKYIGPVEGKRGIFAGVELSEEYAERGKNDGDVDGVRYFAVSVSGAGIFLPSYKATRLRSPSTSTSGFPPTPTTPAFSKFDPTRKQQPASRTPPTIGSIPKFSQSVGLGAKHPFSQTVGPGARAPSPQLKPKSRPSLPRPESPFRKQPNLPPAPATIGRGSVRGIRPSGLSTPNVPKMTKAGTPGTARSPSRSQSRQGQLESSPAGESTPTPAFRPKMSVRGMSTSKPAPTNDEVPRLQRELDERDKQLKEQALALAEMESNLAEVQSLVAASSSQRLSQSTIDHGTENADDTELRAMLKKKQETIDKLTASFDQSRAEFRSTIDTLEIASTTTEQIYDQREKDLTAEVEALRREVEELRNDKEEVQQFQDQYKQFEEAVAELEEAVESARRGESEAKAESEFLHGEVERGLLELKREREKAAKAVLGATAAVAEDSATSAGASPSRDLEQRDTEIKGLKAMIAALTAGSEARSPSPKANGIDADAERALNSQVSALQREKSELRGLIDRKNFREEELERENARLRSANGMPNNYSAYAATAHQTNGNSYPRRDSVSTATMNSANRNSATSTATAFRSSTRGSYTTPPQSRSRPSSGNMARPKSSSAAPPAVEEKDIDDGSTTEGSTADTDSQWCELCEIAGHDILTCSKMLGTDGTQPRTNGFHDAKDRVDEEDEEDRTITVAEVQPLRTSSEKPATSTASFAARTSSDSNRQPHKDELAPAVQPTGTGPAPGKDSGKIDMEKWCAMCERDGHESVDCPFEEW